MENMKRNAHTIPFHRIILPPSRCHNGIRLKNARIEFIKHINISTDPKFIPPIFVSKRENDNGNVIAAVTIFAEGPAAAIIPVSCVRASPLNITAPGAAKTKPVNNANNNERSKFRIFILNSDHNPYFCAINLWESSWTKNAVRIPKNEIGSAIRYLSKEKLYIGEKTKEKANVKTLIARRRWYISVLLNFPGDPPSRVPFGKYMYSLGESSWNDV